MNDLDFAGLKLAVADKISPMVNEMLSAHAPNIHSIQVVGSAVIPDYDDKLSNVNSLVVLNTMDLKFLAYLAPLGKKYGKKRIAAPLVMTPAYINTSLDSFPIEFLDFQLIHRTIYGTDLLKDLKIGRPNLRLQCEREIKAKLIGLRQGYISSLGRTADLSIVLVRSITGSMALFRAIISLLDREPPIPRSEVISAFGSATGIKTSVFEDLLLLKTKRIRPSESELISFFEAFHHALESAGRIVDGIRVY